MWIRRRVCNSMYVEHREPPTERRVALQINDHWPPLYYKERAPLMFDPLAGGIRWDLDRDPRGVLWYLSDKSILQHGIIVGNDTICTGGFVRDWWTESFWSEAWAQFVMWFLNAKSGDYALLSGPVSQGFYMNPEGRHSYFGTGIVIKDKSWFSFISPPFWDVEALEVGTPGVEEWGLSVTRPMQYHATGWLNGGMDLRLQKYLRSRMGRRCLRYRTRIATLLQATAYAHVAYRAVDVYKAVDVYIRQERVRQKISAATDRAIGRSIVEMAGDTFRW